MPRPGLSLVAKMDEQSALVHLRTVAFYPGEDDAALLKRWDDAKAKIGPPMPRAGLPDLVPLDGPMYGRHLRDVTKSPRFAQTVGKMPYTFCAVEIDPLLAFQFAIETDRASYLCASVGNGPSVKDSLGICLPKTLESINYNFEQHPDRHIVHVQSGNFRVFGAGEVGKDGAQGLTLAGIAYGAASPLVQVVKFGGRYYLRNGFHRTLGLRLAGATHVPCVLLQATDYSQLEAPGSPQTFDRVILESADPPTCGHFTQGRAYSLPLRERTWTYTVTWSASLSVEPDPSPPGP